ncbi:sensor histidine kinase [Carboxydothermus hydrogenoformans]|uniref:histidine kinase n=1 Tax=Carboxydothermus hydrogenoformans (strain ATCC BAA-161 / DSM 6008 / Z-2901) TaxID=246194 RepID=Q3AA02_CARHZ|nr:sensor histidine kinase [Carboxydothermus hydrogenoformans]ABB14637.1 sensor histidine kinase [Carboxydothermus hydrogenoformans Z-2901]
MNELFINLIERLSVIITLAFFVSKTRLFRNILQQELTIRQKLGLILGFGLFGIIGTYWGIPIKGAIANSRVVGPAIAGIIGGPAAGLLAGLIAGVHRAWLGGFTAVACGISTTVEGLIAGVLARRFPEKRFNVVFGILTGMFIETLQMIIILLLARPFEDALSLVKVIGLPMILVNGIGIGVFLLILESTVKEKEHIGAVYAEKALNIANETLPILREGLNRETAFKVSRIILNKTDADAVALTDKNIILAHVGSGEDHHLSGTPIKTAATAKALNNGELTVVLNKEAIGCSNSNCKLASAVIAPLFIRNEVVGALKLYYNKPDKIGEFTITFIEGLSRLISTQLELSMLEHQAKLLARAELKALQAQINPHFLFNSLNTIVALCRKNPDQARELIIKLSEYFRRNLREWEPLIPLAEELKNVELYLTFEKARFSDKLQVNLNIDDKVKEVMVPPFAVETLVENAVKHGILPKKGGLVQINAKLQDNKAVIEIVDNGVGLREDVKVGVGLSNLKERLRNLFREEGQFYLYSREDGGTISRLIIPLLSKEALR